MNKKCKSLLLVCCLFLFLCGCAPEITEGEIYKREYREARTVVQLLPLVTSNGKTTTTVLVPWMVHYPERYVVHIKSFINDEWQTEDFYVSREVYDSVKIGDMFCYDSERGDLNNEPYTKERKKDEENGGAGNDR